MSGKWTSVTGPMLGPNLPSFFSLHREVKYFSPYVFILKMHRFLWRIRKCMQSMKKMVTTTTTTTFHAALDPPLAGYKTFCAKRSLYPYVQHVALIILDTHVLGSDPPCSRADPAHPPAQPSRLVRKGGPGAEMDIRAPRPPVKPIFGTLRPILCWG